MLYHWIVRPLCLLILRILYSLLGGFRREGCGQVPRRGGVLITPNHISDADPTAVALAVPRPCYFMAKSELFETPILGTILRLVRGFPVKRNKADRAALRYTEALLEQGEAVVLFPEGKVSEDGKLQPLLPGALLIAQRANVPILPTVILGTDHLMPYRAVVPRHAGRRITVRFGRPVTVEELTGGVKGSEGLKQGAEQLHAILLALQQGESALQTRQENEADSNLADSRV